MTAAPPLFVMSTARSGSTLTRMILDTHPEIYAPPELSLGDLAFDLFRTLAGLAGEGLAAPGPEDARRFPATAARVREIIDGLLSEAAAARGKRVWAEKSPDDLPRAGLLAELFPEARIVCLYRHYQDVVASTLKVCRFGFIPVVEPYVRARPGDVLGALADYWADSVETLLGLEAAYPERAFRLRYEDLVTDPGAVLPDLFRFAGVEWDPDLPGRVFTSHHDEGLGDGLVRYSGTIHAGSLGKGAELPLAGLPMRERVEALAARVGYDGPPAPPSVGAEPPGSPSPAPAGVESTAAGNGTGPVSGQGNAAAELLDRTLPERLAARPDLLPPGVSLRLVVNGEGGDTWVLRTTPEGASLRRGDGSAVGEVRLAAGDLASIAAGGLNALEAVRDGRIAVAGAVDEEALQRLIVLLRAEGTA